MNDEALQSSGLEPFKLQKDTIFVLARAMASGEDITASVPREGLRHATGGDTKM